MQSFTIHSLHRSVRLLLPILLAGFASPPHGRADTPVGKPMPSLSESNLEGTLPSLEGKVVLLDFWASWCAPCKASFPAMADLQRRYADRGLVVLAVSVDDDGRAFARFVEKAAPPFATVRDGQHKLVSKLAVPTMPTSFLMDRKGVIRFRHEGFHGSTTIGSYVTQIEELLAESGS